VGEAILVRAAATAIRVRRRQYELRDHLRALAQAQEAERQARAFAEEAVRIRDEFLSSVAHDLKNPLGAIKGFVQLVQRQLRRGDALDRTRLMEHLDRIDSMITRTTLQIDELLDLARLQADQPLPLSLGPVDLVALAQRVAGWHATSVSHRIQVEARADELVGVWDGHRLERVLSNLLENALKYSPAGGVVSVWVTQEEDWAVLTVEDEGMGIPQEDLPHVFERFYRAANAAHLSGTGLGLAGARQITEQHGGAITIASVQGQGTRVTLRLPMVSGGQAERAPGTG
jgi:signal transduction histidine kinase